MVRFFCFSSLWWENVFWYNCSCDCRECIQTMLLVIYDIRGTYLTLDWYGDNYTRCKLVCRFFFFGHHRPPVLGFAQGPRILRTGPAYLCKLLQKKIVVTIINLKKLEYRYEFGKWGDWMPWLVNNWEYFVGGELNGSKCGS